MTLLILKYTLALTLAGLFAGLAITAFFLPETSGQEEEFNERAKHGSI